jgi:excisionase family DNA binding protein
MDVIELNVRLLRVEEASGILRIGRTKIYELMARGELPVVRMGRSVRIPLRGLQEWIDSQTVSARDVGRIA